MISRNTEESRRIAEPGDDAARLRLRSAGVAAAILMNTVDLAAAGGFISPTRYDSLVDVAIWFVRAATLLLIPPVLFTGIYGVFLRVTAGGNRAKLRKANRIILWSVFFALAMVIADRIVFILADLAVRYLVVGA